MRKAGIRDYPAFAKEVLKAIPDRPISFEVFSDEFPEMARQAKEIASWGRNVYVKIPVTNTRAESACQLVRRLSTSRLKINVTTHLLKKLSGVGRGLEDFILHTVKMFYNDAHLAGFKI